MKILAAPRLPDGLAIVLREAVGADVPGLVALLADDPLGSRRDGIRDTDDLTAYLTAFDTIDRDPAHLLLVAEAGPGAPVGTLQLSVLPGLARRGSRRAQIEAVRVASALRGRGLGSVMIRWAIDEAAAQGCALVQLSTDKSRPEAHRLYERLGFRASHEGMKLTLG